LGESFAHVSQRVVKAKDQQRFTGIVIKFNADMNQLYLSARAVA